MARGKYSADAAKRRAETAEAQLDRLMPKLVDAERTARRYKAEAEAAPVLRRQLAERRQTEGVPLEQYEAAQRQAEQECESILECYDEALTYVIKHLVHYGVIRPVDDEDTAYIDPELLNAFYVLPAKAVEALLKGIGWERGLRHSAQRSLELATKLHRDLHGRHDSHGNVWITSSSARDRIEYVRQLQAHKAWDVRERTAQQINAAAVSPDGGLGHWNDNRKETS